MVVVSWALEAETAMGRPCLGQRRVSDIRAADVSCPDMRRGGCDCLRDMLDVPM